MDTLYDRQYRKIVELETIADGSGSTFETGGTNLRVARAGQRATAFELIDAVSPGAATSERELPVEVRDGWVWVCIDLCS